MKLHPLFIDGFAGGGGASTGIGQALGRDVDIAINHSPTAIAIHKANHPDTEHHCTDIRTPFLPRTATRGRPVAGAWFSPDCKEYSKAKGGPVKDRSIRALCWEVIHWLEETLPDVGYLENVEEFEYAAPLDGNGVPLPDHKGREFKKFKRSIRRLGYRVQHRLLIACKYGTPTSRKRLYMIFRRDGKPIVWPKPTHAPANDPRVLAGKLLPYRTAAECIDWSIRCPSIFDRAKELVDATKRRIAHGVMRYVVDAARNGQRPFIVPVTHTGDVRVHDSLDPLRTITTANGGELAAVDVGLAPHITKFRRGAVGSDAANPMPTVTANGEPERPAGAVPLGLVAGTLARLQNGERRPGERPRDQPLNDTFSTIATGGKFAAVGTEMAPLIDRQFGNSTPDPVTQPLGATTAGGGGKSAQVSAFLTRYYGSDKRGAGGDIEGQIPVIRAGGTHHGVVVAHMEQANGGPRNLNSAGRSALRPLSTATTKGSQQRVVETTLIEEGSLPPEMMERAVNVAAFLVKYYGTDGDGETAQIQPVDRPIDTVTTKARFAVVTVTIDAVTYVIVDIGLRMLKPRELARAQGFPDTYVLDPVVRKFLRGKWVEKRLTIAEQISAIGNSVCPPVARALVAANQPDLCNWQPEAIAA
ncbi:C-5 cytosine-specific DNA methylase [Sphingopyxis macrogoltabida]|uniref:DNA (cytosine-5-)-methyltransferase n=1 Tax=Sphingopyxis macrogoltabida TaxID=33050 RepID=A0A0N9UGQ2_SPHMC|nr:DNA cytosine methyltransferase [Sphingopyxis macrogoltabida]ALH82924.1 C-5 cytosine-specific DNA methylase [Sphingopyxis macrogoltabida]